MEKKKKRQALESHPPPCPLEDLFNRKNCQIIGCHHPLHCPLQITALLSHAVPEASCEVCMDLPGLAGSHPSRGAQNCLSVPLDTCRSPLCPQHLPGSGLALESRADTATAKCEPAENPVHCLQIRLWKNQNQVCDLSMLKRAPNGAGVRSP